MEVFLDTCGRRRVKSLFLLYLFVVKAAADCPKPQGKVNIVLTDEALLKNDFPKGSEVTLECANGYVKESGSGVMSCIDDKWGEPDLICQKKDCGPPKPQPNMNFNTSAGTRFGDTIRVTCNKGYRLSGSSYKQCYASGWTGRPKCQIVTCRKPDEVANGRHSWVSQEVPKYGESIQFFCNEGYTLVGKDSILCRETGEYDSQLPACEGAITEDAFTTKTVAPTSTPPAQEASTATDSPTTPSPHRDKSVTTSATPTVSPSVRGGSLTAEGKATTPSVTSVTSSSFQGKHDETVDTNKDIGYMPVIVSVICVVLAVCIIAIFIHKYLLKRKGVANGTYI
ncbi:complement decay-accelerating factor isoform X2 [Centropristis striata]|uniref:complement decay-accelerating factor isoform X2 n=1 Tax=Centropristis striata TaxID=184440 RepID=UPI0027DEB3AA|nr:complement decay-accelerating factor isoform X2 [Centropristis striata]